MAVLETLYLLFKADTTNLKKGLDDALKTVDKSTEKIGQKFLGLTASFAGLIASIVSVNSLISGMKNTISYDINIGKESRILGVRPEELDVWSRAVVRAGGTAEDFQTSLRGLANHFHTTASVVLKSLPQLADSFSHMNRYASFNYGKAIGLTEPMILLLQQGRRELESLLKHQRDLGVVTEKDAKVSKEYNEELKDLNTSFTTLSNAIIIPLLPSLTKFFHALQMGFKYLTEHKDLVIGAFIGIGAAAFSAGVAFGLITIEGLLLTAAIILLIALFALLFDDIRGYIKGDKSLLGEYIDEWKRFFDLLNKGWESVTNKIADYLEKFKLTKPFGESIKEFNKTKKFGIERLLDIDLINSSSNTNLNNKTPSGHFYESSFNKNSVINTGDIIVNTQATDAEGISKDIGLKLTDHISYASNIFADNIYA